MDQNGARCDSRKGEKRMKMRRRRVIAKEVESGNEENGGEGPDTGRVTGA
jgi:hypothetical protein